MLPFSSHVYVFEWNRKSGEIWILLYNTTNQELMVYKFELGHNAAEATKNICCVNDEGAVDLSTVTKWFKKFRSGWKNDDQAMSGWPKTVHSETALQAIEPNPVSSTWRESSELGISQSSLVRSSSSRPRRIRRVALEEYQASSSFPSPVWFVVFTTSD